MTAQSRERILPRLIEEEMRESFLDYSMSPSLVNVSVASSVSGIIG